ncbi:hypothetical protein [Cupriavidus pauculus]|uniref:DUF2570 domain-containing protein n=1 Tax=Cupriavidus pauculus TaxID=82633 RepID=A0A2N5C440_9BURK|nr:hypothetical protein [Cupriavidus pauculus]PLP96982.1 hypothetical protein CYJ10_29510 [Cupriavidus pauculus]
MSGAISRVVGVVLFAVAIFAAGWVTNGWRKDAEIDRIKAASAQADLASANAALGDLRLAGETIRTKADEFSVAQTKLGAKLDAIQKDMKNAKPLPADCRPDDFRVRKLSDAVEAAKQAAAAR